MWDADQKLVPNNISMTAPLEIRPMRIPGLSETQDTVFANV
jgi:hypothetical protein